MVVQLEHTLSLSSMISAPSPPLVWWAFPHASLSQQLHSSVQLSFFCLPLHLLLEHLVFTQAHFTSCTTAFGAGGSGVSTGFKMSFTNSYPNSWGSGKLGFASMSLAQIIAWKCACAMAGTVAGHLQLVVWDFAYTYYTTYVIHSFFLNGIITVYNFYITQHSFHTVTK